MFVKPEESLFVPDLCLVLFIHITNYGILIILVCSINTTLHSDQSDELVVRSSDQSPLLPGGDLETNQLAENDV